MTTSNVATVSKNTRQTRAALNKKMADLSAQMHEAEMVLMALDADTAPLEDILKALETCEGINAEMIECQDRLSALDDLGVDLVAAICTGAGSIELADDQIKSLGLAAGVAAPRSSGFTPTCFASAA